jgi:hypothetical protein
MGCFWPFSAIDDIDFQATSITAFWLGPEPTSMDGALAAVDPQRSLMSNSRIVLSIVALISVTSLFYRHTETCPLKTRARPIKRTAKKGRGSMTTVSMPTYQSW